MAIDIGIVLFCLLEKNYGWFLNTQVAFASSLLVTTASFLGYKKMVEDRLAAGAAEELSKFDDPYELNEEEEPEPNTKPRQPTIKKLGAWQAFVGALRGHLSLFRLGAYLILILGFIALHHRGLLEPVAYIFGLTIVPAATVTMLLLEKNRSDA
ncbi:MAG: hypothetical protein K6347_00610 [Campylobacterales bacterium]